MIIGLGHKKQVGKDTVGRFIQSLNPTMERRSFAEKLKEVASVLFNVPVEKWSDAEFKESIIGYESGAPIGKLDEAITPRKILQKIGESLRDNLDENIWVNALLNTYILISSDNSTTIINEVEEDSEEEFGISMTSVQKKFPNWIITDVRYPNEAKAIKDRGGILIRINRNTGFNDNHISETALDNYDGWDYIIDNNGTLTDLFNQVKEIYEKIREKDDNR